MTDKDYPHTQNRKDGVFRVHEDGSEERIDAEGRMKELEKAVGKHGAGKRGVAHRLDNLEDEIGEIKNELGMS